LSLFIDKLCNLTKQDILWKFHKLKNEDQWKLESYGRFLKTLQVGIFLSQVPSPKNIARKTLNERRKMEKKSAQARQLPHAPQAHAHGPQADGNCKKQLCCWSMLPKRTDHVPHTYWA